MSIERIHAANLINFGILPLLFQSAADRELIQVRDSLTIADLHAQLAVGKPLEVVLSRRGGETVRLACRHAMSAEDVATVLAGGRLCLASAKLSPA